MYEPTEYEIEQRLARWDQTAALKLAPELAPSLVTRDEMKELVRETSGRLVFRGEPEYDELRKLFYSNFDEVRPFVIAVCKTVHDVQSVLDYVKKSGIRWVPRSGGHSTAGYSTVEDGLMMDLRGLNNVFVDAAREVVHAGPGTQFRDLYRAVYQYGLFVPAGICPEVRVGGYMQGGGYGFASRWFGMNCDNVLEAEVVLASGRPVLASASQNRDLFWALRGGTGNNFGIVTRVTYRLHRLREVSGVKLTWRLRTDEEVELGARLLDKLQRDYMATNDNRRLGYMAFIMWSKDDLFLEIRALYRAELDAWRELLKDFVDTPGLTWQTYGPGPYHSVNNQIMGYREDPELSPFRELMTNALPPQEKQSRFFDKQLGVDGWRKVILHMRSWQLDPDLGSYQPLYNLEAGGAAIDDVPRNGNAYVHRNCDFNAFLNVYWKSEAQREKAFAFLDGWLAVSEPWTNGEAYQNYPKSYVTDYARRYWAEAYPVLCAVKQKYDPDRLFDFEQAVGADGRCPENALDLAEKLVPDVARALREPIQYADAGVAQTP